MASCDTGSITVKVYDAEGNQVRNTIVDTYYGYTLDENGNWNVTTDSDNAIYQVPVIKIAGLTYGEYTVTIKAAWNDALDHIDGSTSYDFYLDAIRIYDPTGNKNEDVNEVYVSDHEGWPYYEELRNNVIDAATLNDSVTEINGICFLDCIPETSSASDYTDYGPNNELYLDAGQAIAFELNLPANVDTVQLGIKSADGNEVSYKIVTSDTITDSDSLDKVAAQTLSTATDMYYDITSYTEKGTILVYNCGESGILSLTNIKLTFTADPGTVENLFYVSSETISTILENMSKDPTFVPTKLEISTSPSTVYAGNKITVKVTTGTDVAAVSVNGELITSYSTDSNGNCIWTAKVSTSAAGDVVIPVIAYNSNGIASATTNVTVAVTSVVATIRNWLNTLFSWWN